VKRRTPLIGIAFGAAAGIFATETLFADYAAAKWLLLAFVGTVAMALVTRRSSALIAAAATAFSCLHGWNGPWSAGTMLAESIGPSRRLAQFEGVVQDTPQAAGATRRGDPLHKATVRVSSLIMDGKRMDGTFLATALFPGETTISKGSHIRGHGTFQRPAGPRNPGEFDRATYLRRKGICLQISFRSPRDWTVLEDGSVPLWERAVVAAQEYVKRTLHRDLEDSPHAAAVIHGIVMGAGTDTPQELKELFRLTGTLHLFAVSGLHVGLFAILVWAGMRPFARSPRISVALLLPALVAYAAVTGFKPSVMRAVVMAAVVLIGLALDRRSSMPNGLAGAFVILLAWDTHELFEAGFQFSFAVVAAIFLLSRPIANSMKRLGMPDPFLPEGLLTTRQRVQRASGRWLGEALGVSGAAWIGSVPCSIALFHLLTPIGVLANLPLVPLSFVILALGLLSAAAGLMSVPLAVLFNNANLAVANIILWLVGASATVPAGAFYVAPPRIPPPQCEIISLDVAAGGADIIKIHGKNWLIDAGSPSDATFRVGPALHAQGINRLDGMLLTHGDVRHLGGALECVKTFRPRQIWISGLPDRSSHRRALEGWLLENSLELGLAHDGQDIQIDSTTSLRILHPPAGVERRVSDDKGVVALLEVGKWKVLFLSDAGTPTFHWLRETYPGLHADFIFKGANSISGHEHPGSIAVFSPRAVVATAQAFPEHEQLTQSWIQEVEARGSRVLCKEETGAVSVRLWNDRATASGFLTGEMLALPAQ
jgi:competence protein ComEC